MQALAFIGVGLVGMGLAEAAASVLALRFAVPDVALLVATFCALRRPPVPMTLTAAGLGYLAGRHAVAPDGVCVLALVATAVAVFTASGSLTGGGRGFFVLAVVAAHLGYQGLMWGLGAALWGHVPAGQLGAVVQQGAATGLAAALVQPLLVRLEAALAPSRREGLRWR